MRRPISRVLSLTTIAPFAKGRWPGTRTVLLAGSMLLFPVMLVRAQTATLSGIVTAAADGRPLDLANVVLMKESRIVTGTVSSPDGFFVIPRIAPGRYTVRASSIGFATYADTLDLEPGEVRTLAIALDADAEVLNEVVVQSERRTGTARVTAGQQTIRPADVELVPTVDVSGDLASYLTALPGVVTTGDQGGQLFIRGGEPSQNLVLLDGIPLFQPFHLLGFYSAFPADVIGRTDLYAGGFGARFGNRLSSVLDISTRNGHTQRYSGAVGLSPFVSSARLEGPIFTERVSLLASVRQSVVEHTGHRLTGQPLPFTFGDFFAKLHAEPSRRSRVSATALHTYDRGVVGETVGGTSSEEVRWRNRAAGLRYLILPRLLPVIGDFRASVSQLQSELGPPGSPVRTSNVTNVHLSLDGTFPGERFSVEAGWRLDLLRFQSELGGLYQNFERRDSRLAHFAFYLEPEVVFRAFRVRPSLRTQFYFAIDKPVLEPRLRVVWEHGMHQISGATGVYLQEFIGLVDRRDAASVFTVWTNTPKKTETRLVGEDLVGRLPRAIHAIAGYRISPGGSWEASVESFYKHLSDLFVAEWTAFPRLTTRLHPARGRSFGLDARFEIRHRSAYALANYGLSSTRYRAEHAALQLWYGAERLDFRPGHDRRHQINTVLGATLRKVDLSVRWAFGSGLPFSRPLGFDGFVLVDDLIDAYSVPKSRRVIYDRPFNALLPAYHRLDVSAGRTFTLQGAKATIQASAINLYDRRNVFYLDVFTLRRVDQLPFIPSIGFEVVFE